MQYRKRKPKESGLKTKQLLHVVDAVGFRSVLRFPIWLKLRAVLFQFSI